MEAGGFHNTFLTLRSNQGWMYCLPPNLSGPFETSSHQKDPCSIRGKPWTSLDHLEVLGISQKFEEAVEVNCLGSKGKLGKMGISWYPHGPWQPRTRKSLEKVWETSEQVMEWMILAYFCWGILPSDSIHAGFWISWHSCNLDEFGDKYNYSETSLVLTFHEHGSHRAFLHGSKEDHVVFLPPGFQAYLRLSRPSALVLQNAIDATNDSFHVYGGAIRQILNAAVAGGSRKIKPGNKWRYL